MVTVNGEGVLIFVFDGEGLSIKMANVNASQNLDNTDVMEIELTKVDQLWPTKNETIFIELMDEQVALKNWSTTAFTRESWNYMF
ncbi:unnamed protein product [Ilex paraguariensis]|uniref:Uncharacterized protein n=1 Tax=Ilex paraguariensis TaxID=185542 RepID=A0ABC8RS33_9AQUA